MAKRKAIRIAVGTTKAMQSSVWKIWTEKDEIYVLARETGRFLKLSLHKSGKWRLAYVSARDKKDPLITDNDPRVLMRWNKPANFIPGWTQCLDILVPATGLSNLFAFDPFDQPKSKITWLDPIKVGHKAQITLLLADSLNQKINSVLLAGDGVIDRLELKSGRILWVTLRRIKMSDAERKHVEFMASDMKITFDNDPGEYVFGAIFSPNNQSNHPEILNFALSWDNVYVKGK